MAEASVENTSSARYFCHKCNEGISPLLPDFLCPKCNLGFIEQLGLDSEAGNADNRDRDSVNTGNQNINYLQLFEQALAPLFVQGINNGLASQPTSPDTISSNREDGQNNSVRNVRITLPDSFGVIPEILLHFQTLDRLMVRPERHGNSLLFPRLFNLHGNPADYVWNGGDFDAIMTQLMNQIQGSGPAPLSKEKINEIPTVKITKEQTERSLQCTICMDDFGLDEEVRRLPCDHHYHNQCIVPWLQMHGTCPICRVVLNPEETPASRETGNVTSDSSNANGSTNDPEVLRCNVM